MHPVLLVARRDFLYHMMKPSFILTTLLVPLFAFSFTLLMDWLPAEALMPELEEVAPGVTLPAGREVVGFVDHSGVIERVPAFLEGWVRPYGTAAAAGEALRAGEITAYYIVGDDYLRTGAVERVMLAFEPIPTRGQPMELLLIANLVGEEEPRRLQLLQQPVQEENLEIESSTGRAGDSQARTDQHMIFAIAFFLAFMMYSTTFMAASYLLRSLTTEKESRVMELLLTSIRPGELLAGKLLGLGLLAFGQFLLWATVGYLATTTFAVELPVDRLRITWPLALMMGLYALLGYAIFSTIMAGIGALAPTTREVGPLSLLVILPAMIPLALLQELVSSPQGVFAIALSIIPFTAPISMVTRFAQGAVPLWQIVLSVALMLLAARLSLAITIRLFRAQTLLASDLSLGRLWQALVRSRP